MNSGFFIRTFILFLGLLGVYASSSCSKICRGEGDIGNEKNSKLQRVEVETKMCGICNAEAVENIQFCSCNTAFHFPCLITWFRENKTMLDYSCKECGEKINLLNFLKCSEKPSGLQVLISLNMPIKSMKVSEDQSSFAIKVERNGFIFTLHSKVSSGKNIFVPLLAMATMMENFDMIRFIFSKRDDFRVDPSIWEEVFRVGIKHNLSRPIKLLLDLGIKSILPSKTLEYFTYQALIQNSNVVFVALFGANEDPMSIFSPEGKSLFKVAIEQNNQNIISYLIKRSIIPDDVLGSEVNLDNEIINPMIDEILKQNNIQGMRNVLMLKIPFSSYKSSNYYSILECSAGHSREMFELLLSSGLSFAENKELEKIRCYANAVVHDRFDVLDLMRDFEINTSVHGGISVLHLGINWSRDKIVEHALKNGADPNTSSTKYGYNLHYAISKNNYNIVSMLLKAGARRDLRDKNGHHAYTIALITGKFESFKAIAENTEENIVWYQDGFNNLHLAIACGKLQIVEYLLNLGIAPVKKDGTITWMIFTLASKERSEMLEYLFEKCGADVYEGILIDQNPLLRAISHDRIKNVEVFLKYGYNPNKRIHQSSSTLLHFALELKKFDIAYLLIKYGADTNAVDYKGKTAFSFVQDDEIIERLMNLDELL